MEINIGLVKNFSLSHSLSLSLTLSLSFFSLFFSLALSVSVHDPQTRKKGTAFFFISLSCIFFSLDHYPLCLSPSFFLSLSLKPTNHYFTPQALINDWKPISWWLRVVTCESDLLLYQIWLINLEITKVLKTKKKVKKDDNKRKESDLHSFDQWSCLPFNNHFCEYKVSLLEGRWLKGLSWKA